MVVSVGEDSDQAAEPATRFALAARAGDPDAATAFVRGTQAEVWRFVAALAGVDAADDLTQETYLRAFRALPGYAGRSSARTWLLAIARRVCADHIRATVRGRRLAAAAAPAGTPAEQDPAGLAAVADLLRRLPAERAVAFVLTQVLGLSYAEAAAVEEIPVATIRSRVARARADLMGAVEAARSTGWPTAPSSATRSPRVAADGDRAQWTVAGVIASGAGLTAAAILRMRRAGRSPAAPVSGGAHPQPTGVATPDP